MRHGHLSDDFFCDFALALLKRQRFHEDALGVYLKRVFTLRFNL